MNLDGFSMRPLTIELERKLVGGRVDKITQQSKTSITIQIRQPGETFLLQISINPQNPSIQIIKNPLENLPEPPTFCMVLRKNLENGRIASIRQHEVDRVIFIDVDTLNGGKIATLTLVIELVGKYSNMILVNDGIIIDALKKIGNNNSRVRTVLPNQEYQLPPAQNKLNPFETSVEELVEKIELSDERLDKAIMNVCQGFGPVSAKEVAYRSQNETLTQALSSVINECQNPSACFIIDVNKKILAMSSFKINYVEGTLKIFESISAMLEKANELIGSYVPPDKEVIGRLLKNELKRATNKISVLTKELNESEKAEDFKIMADNLLTYQYQLKDHELELVKVKNIYSESEEEIEIKLDKRLTITSNIQALYKKYDKLKRGAEYIQEQIKICTEEINYLESIEQSLTSSTTIAEIDEVKAELIAGKYMQEGKKKTSSDKKSKPFKFELSDGTEILVGKNNLQNDKIRQTASPNDIWLHTKDIPGSHVIMKCAGLKPSDENLLKVAKIAAYFSKFKDSSNVPVDYTECKFVKKPSRSKPGFVIFFNQHTVYVTPDDETKALIENVY